MDGDSRWGQSLVLHSGEDPWSFRILLPVQTDFALGKSEWRDDCWITGDSVQGCAGQCSLQFLSAQCAGGCLSKDQDLLLGGTVVKEGELRVESHGRWVLAALCRAGRWALALGETKETAAKQAEAALLENWNTVRDARRQFLEKVLKPHQPKIEPEYRELLAKALSVMKVNTESASGTIRRRWSTPDRWPHQAMWLWDSAFHAVGMSCFDGGLAAEILWAVMDEIREDGFLPHCVNPAGERSKITQPPILGWALLKLGKLGELPDEIGNLLERNVHFLRWCEQNRDVNGNGLLEWDIEENPLCRSGESGMDNSPRFDGAVLMDAPDFSSFLAHDYLCCAELAERLGKGDLARECRRKAKRIGDQVNRYLWNEENRFYQDRLMDGSWVQVKAVSGFMPLFAGIATPEQAQALVEHLEDPMSFGATMPVPSVSLDTGTFCKDMWRGPTWICTNAMIIEGLHKYGYDAEAARLRRRTLDEINRWYQKEGCLFEYYDSLGATSPRGLDRKQRLSLGTGMATISDFHWTAALTAALIVQDITPVAELPHDGDGDVINKPEVTSVTCS